MIREAGLAGVDCVKFQKSCLPEKFTASALARPYDSPNAFGPTYGEHKRRLEFTIEQFKELKDYAESCGLVFSASAMDEVSLAAPLSTPTRSRNLICIRIIRFHSINSSGWICNLSKSAPAIPTTFRSCVASPRRRCR
jgi:NeuB family